MTGLTDKIKGAVNKAVGAGKQKLGEVMDDPELEGEGIAQNIKGKGQSALGDAKEAVSDAVETTKEKAKEVARDAKDAIHRATR